MGWFQSRKNKEIRCRRLKSDHHQYTRSTLAELLHLLVITRLEVRLRRHNRPRVTVLPSFDFARLLGLNVSNLSRDARWTPSRTAAVAPPRTCTRTRLKLTMVRHAVEVATRFALHK